MKYMGSKARHAKEFLPIMLAGRKPDQWYVEPFVGGANVIDKVYGRRIGGDANPDLIILLQAMAGDHHYRNGPFTPPDFVSEQNYNEAKSYSPGPLKSYVGFGLSYGGKWFGGYRRDSIGKRDYSAEAKRNYMKQAPLLEGVDFHFCSYDQLHIPQNSIVYCDPPYEGTTKYATGNFNHANFWRWCDAKVDEGHSVFVSEYTAPDEWKCVWEKTVNNTLTKDTGSKQGVERLFRKSA